MKTTQNSTDIDSHLEALFEKFREICESEYRRGNREALAQIAQLVQKAPPTPLISTGPVARVPRGASSFFVQKILQKNGGAFTISEIRQRAQNDIERALSYQTVRLELERGKKVKKYRKTGSKWSAVK